MKVYSNENALDHPIKFRMVDTLDILTLMGTLQEYFRKDNCVCCKRRAENVMLSQCHLLKSNNIKHNKEKGLLVRFHQRFEIAAKRVGPQSNFGFKSVAVS